MSMTIYIGNLPVSATADAIQALFNPYGTVEQVNLITDRATGRLRGFGFVEMSSGADAAMANLDQTKLDGRTLTVNRAKSRQPRSRQPRRG